MIKLIKQWWSNFKYAREKRKFMGSKEPWVYVRGESIDPEKGLRLDMDWNEAFVKHLRSQGVKGTKDEDVVSCWLTMVNQQLLGQVEED